MKYHEKIFISCHGYGIGATYTFAKNMVGTVVYYDTENKLNSKEDDKRLWADLTVTF